MHRYTLLCMKTKRMAVTGKWVSCVKARTNPKSCLLNFCELVLQHGYGHELCQVQAIDTTHAWVCAMEENSIGSGCVKMKLKKAINAVELLAMRESPFYTLPTVNNVQKNPTDEHKNECLRRKRRNEELCAKAKKEMSSSCKY